MAKRTAEDVWVEWRLILGLRELQSGVGVGTVQVIWTDPMVSLIRDLSWNVRILTNHRDFFYKQSILFGKNRRVMTSWDLTVILGTDPAFMYSTLDPYSYLRLTTRTRS
jgi:hypothetical protein